MQAGHEQSRGRGPPLEDHLRNLILTNSDPRAVLDPNSPSPVTFASIPPPENNPQARGEVRDDQTYRSSPRATSRGGKKRPNQAQRRQMNAELSIPIDTRGPSHSPSRQYARPQPHGDARSLPYGQQHIPYSSASPAPFQGRAAPNDRHPYGQSRQGYTQLPTPSSLQQSDWRRQQHPNVDGLFRGVNIISADDFASRNSRLPHQYQSTLYNPGAHRQTPFSPEQPANQSAFLDRICQQIVMGAEIGPDEIFEKEQFRGHIETICRHAIARHEFEVNGYRGFQPESVELKCFGSLASGFATKAADMDLGLLSPMSKLPPDSHQSPIPRLIEEALLTAGFGARLLTKTRVPIIKLCEKPGVALRQSLLDARTKWENGVEEERDPDDDVPEDQDPPPTAEPPSDTSPKQNSTKTQTSQQSSMQAALPHDEDLSSLKQSSNQSLASYYNNAKRLLRRLNGRDITYSNYQDFTEANFILLDKVASVFVKGLYDSNLRDRILAYPSFHIGDTTKFTNYRSLFGINTMIEGEKLVLAWETRQLSSDIPKTDQVHERVIQHWKDLQYSKKFGLTPMWYNKELQLAVEALRQLPAIQIMHLRQEQYESPMQYHNRANKISTSFRDTLSISGVGIRCHIINHYVDGIRDEGIRNKVHEFVALTGTQTLRTVAREHKALHLAADYERAIEQGRYGPEDVQTLQSYMAILRRKPMRSIQRPADFEYVIPIMPNEEGVLGSVRQLPDPATLSPNKPRDRYNDSLEFPKSGVGVQCDINFSAQLALENTRLLRCYCYTDPRVKPLVLFVKHWAKARGINTPYRGTLSSYGYVLMVLHYLVNIVEPFVCPNLQELAPPDPDLPPQALEGITTCQGRNVRFWRDERAIQSLAQQGQLNQNHDSLGSLLRGFFEYYAQSNMMVSSPKRGFDWGRDVISLRTHGGLLSKGEKGWTGAKTVMQPQGGAPPASAELTATTAHFPSPDEKTTLPLKASRPSPSDGTAQSVTEQQAPKSKDVKEIRHRFLFAIEDPFELDHNVARTVTHNGIVAIRDEFRRAWRIIKAAGKGHTTEDLLEDIKAHKEQLERKQFISLLDEIHGNEVFPDSTVI
ncbi:hypothetical protein F5Y10DRAFT_24631 [Nemania abortiva]|nr:hypothetical protein F5Y10DRAFT_24631 [Nemania abortiva]